MTDHGSSIVDRYIHAVRRLLPRAQRDDIASELREILQSQVDDEETLLQRPLSDVEVTEILKRYGHPRKVAVGYGSRGYLIGPEVFPYYVMGVKFVLRFMAVVTVFMVWMTVFMSETNSVGAVAETLWTMLSIALVNLAIVTLVFASGGIVLPWRDDADWNPDDLPDPDPAVRRSDVMGSLLSLILLLAWWLGVNGVLFRWFGWDPMPFEWTDVWTDVYYGALGVILASIGREVIALVRPRSTKLYTGLGVTLDLFAFFIAVRLLRAGTYVAATEITASGPGSLLVAFLDKSIFLALIMATIAVITGVVTGTRRLVRLSRLTPRLQH